MSERNKNALGIFLIFASFISLGTGLYKYDKYRDAIKRTPVCNQVPSENLKFRIKITNAGWVSSDYINIGEDGYAWSKHNRHLSLKDSHEKTLLNAKDSCVFLVVKEDRWEAYLPKEHKNHCWTACLGDVSGTKSVEIIPTDVPISAFNESLQMGVSIDMAALIKEYTPSTTLVAENGVK